jgi:hypothetical protein
MSPRNITMRLDQIEKIMGQPSELIIEIYPGGIFLDIGGLERHPKMYGTHLLEFILDDLPPGTTIIRSDVPRKGLFKQPTVKKPRKSTRKEPINAS